MNRVLLTAQLMEQKHRATVAHERYISAVHEYMPQSRLYMREVHFVAAASPERPVSIADIAKKLEVTGGAVSQIAARLEKKGYIIRHRAADDRRQMLVTLTVAGRELFARHREYDRVCMEEISKVLGQFSEEDLVNFIKYEALCYEIFCSATGGIV